MKIPISGFNIAAIYCDNLNESVDFYSRILGFEKQAEMDGGIQLGGIAGISLYLQGGYPKDHRDYASSKIPLCFHTPSVKDAFNRAQELKLPVKFDYREISDNYAMFCVSDPSGNQIMLTSL